jgi:protein gp37
MASTTKIEWVKNNDGSQGQSWNFLRGCRRVSEGCTNCYAERQAIRHAGPGGPYEGLVKSTPNGPRWTGEISFHEEILLAPLKRKKPTTYFVNSMSDLFYEKVSDEILDKAFAVMALCPQHTFQILTKRPERMREYCQRFAGRASHLDTFACWASAMATWLCDSGVREYQNDGDGDSTDHVYEELLHSRGPDRGEGFFENIWLGVSVEDQKTADERIPILLQTPAAIRWLSVEPLLGPINLTHIQFPNTLGNMESWDALDLHTEVDPDYDPDKQNGCTHILDWIVVGGESGPGARPCDVQWIRSIIEQCKAAQVPVFVKQLGAQPFEPKRYAMFGDAGLYLNNRKGGDPSEWPSELRVREFPK